jgi:hypothetical protein
MRRADRRCGHAHAMLDEFYFADARLTLVPIEHWSRAGIAPGFAAQLRSRAGWSTARVELLDMSLRLYWQRVDELARRGRDLSPPRRRNVGVVRDPLSARPYASILNTSTWMLYENDLDPERSNPEFVSFLLAHGDRMAETGEVTLAAVHLAAWWFERSPAERTAFAAAAHASQRPDAASYRAIADAQSWLRELRHVRLRPPRSPAGHRAIPGTGLLVPRALEHEPDRLVAACRAGATTALEEFYGRWRTPDAAAVADLLAWLRDDAPPLLVVGHGGRTLWDPQRADRVADVAAQLQEAGGAAVQDVAADLHVVAQRTRRFRAALRDPEALPPPDPLSAQSGYSYMHATRRLIAYNLHEPGIERLAGPALPYARAMLAARTVHEWAHLAADAGYVPRAVDHVDWAARCDALATLLDETIARAPRAVRERCAADVRALSQTGSPGAALAAIFTTRLPDWQANLLAFRFLGRVEREAYVRQNIRPLAREFQPHQLWRHLVRTLYEYQYLALGEVPDRRSYFVDSTWFARDFFSCDALDEQRFDELAAAARAICAAHAVDESRLLPVDDPTGVA